MTEEQLHTLKSLLEAERDRLVARLRPTGAWDEELQDNHTADVMDRVDVDKSRDLLLTAETGDKQKWLAVNHALTKIERGTYGLCEDCGEEIAYPRLEAYPTAALCVHCQRQWETHETEGYRPRPGKRVGLRAERMEEEEENDED